ncbi:MAG: hypothetical protein JJU00_16325 [Opitutales bacterium]|nr:hypothetical protein [Opitutales bacterium]
MVDRASGAYAIVEGPRIGSDSHGPWPLWTEEGAAVFYAGALARFDYAGMQGRTDALPEYAFTHAYSAQPFALREFDGGLHWWVREFPFGSLFPAGYHDIEAVPSPFDNVGGGRWREGERAVSHSFGTYFVRHAPWYYFEDYGYGYSPPQYPQWLYFPYVGWLWTREGVFPRLYCADTGGWLRYRRSDGPLAWFEHTTKRYWVDTAPGWAPLDLSRLVLHLDFDGDEETWTFSNNIAATVRYFDDEDSEWVSFPLWLEVERLDPDTLRLHVAAGIYIEGEYTLTFHSAFAGEADGELRVYGVDRVLLHVESGSGTFAVDR